MCLFGTLILIKTCKKRELSRHFRRNDTKMQRTPTVAIEENLAKDADHLRDVTPAKFERDVQAITERIQEKEKRIQELIAIKTDLLPSRLESFTDGSAPARMISAATSSVLNDLKTDVGEMQKMQALKLVASVMPGTASVLTGHLSSEMGESVPAHVAAALAKLHEKEERIQELVSLRVKCAPNCTMMRCAAGGRDLRVASECGGCVVPNCASSFLIFWVKWPDRKTAGSGPFNGAHLSRSLSGAMVAATRDSPPALPSRHSLATR